MPYVTTWMELGGVMLRDVSQRQTDKCSTMSQVEREKTSPQIRSTGWWEGGSGGGGRLGEGAQRPHFSYKMSKLWDTMYSMEAALSNMHCIYKSH